MNARSAARLAWALCGLSIVMVAIGAPLLVASGHTPIDTGTDHGGNPLLMLDTLVGAVVGTLIASCRPSNPVGWLVSFSSLTEAAGLNGLGYGYAYYSLEGPGGPLPGAVWLAWLSTAIENAGLFAAILTFVLFPTGRPPTRGWVPIVWFTVGAGVLLSLAVALRPGSLANFPALENPLGLPGAAGDLAIAVSGFYQHGAAPMLLAVAAASLLIRFRGSRGVERQQLKWVAYAVTLFPLVFGAMLVTERVGIGASLDPAIWQWIGTLAFTLARSGLGISIAIAILRYRLYDIDPIIRRTLVYGVLSASLVMVYWASVVSLQQALRPLTAGSDLAIVASTLAVAALFQPARQRIQRAVDRRFYRQRFDASRTLEAFSARLRHQVDLDSLGLELLATVRRTMQPQVASLWLYPTPTLTPTPTPVHADSRDVQIFQAIRGTTAHQSRVRNDSGTIDQ